MQFVYDKKNEEDRNIVAIIDADGDLVFRGEKLGNQRGIVALNRYTNIVYFSTPYDFYDLVKTAKKVFYEGDEITIKF